MATIYTYDYQNGVRDLQKVLSTVMSQYPGFVSLVRSGQAATAKKHEWLEDQIAPRNIEVTNVATLTITASAADIAKLKVGTQISNETDPAVFVVASIDSTTTATVTLLSQNGSSVTAPAVGTMGILGTPMYEGTSHGDGEEGNWQSDTNYNYTQIFRKDTALTGSSLAIETFDRSNQIARQEAIKLQELTRDLNRLIIKGVRVEPTSSVKGSFGGLYSFATGLSVDASSAAIDQFLINDAAQLVMAEGGMMDVLLCSIGQARVISAINNDQVRIVREDRVRGSVVMDVVNDVTGRTQRVVGDYDMPDSDAFAIDMSGLALCPLRGRGPQSSDSTNNDFDGIKRKIIAEMTLECKNANQRIAKITNLKSSVEALAAIRSGSTS